MPRPAAGKSPVKVIAAKAKNVATAALLAAELAAAPMPHAQIAEQIDAAGFLPYQRAWALDRSPVKVCLKGRRTGISFATGPEAVEVAARTKKAGGMNVWYMAHDKEVTREFIDYCALFARAMNEVASDVKAEVLHDGERDIQTFVIYFASGFKITALASRAAGIRGRQGLVIIDEAAFVDLELVLAATLPILIRGGRIIIISTPFGMDNEFWGLIEDIRAKRNGRGDWHLHTVTFDDAIRQGLYQQICQSNGEEWTVEKQIAWRAKIVKDAGDAAGQEFFCIPNNSSGTYLSRALIESRQYPAPIVRLDLPEGYEFNDDRIAKTRKWCDENLQGVLDALPNLPHCYGMDFGRVNDLSVIAPMTIEQAMDRRVPFLVEIRRGPFDVQQEILFYLIDRLPRLVGGALDATGNGLSLAEKAAQQYGPALATQITLNDKRYAEILPPFKAAFEDGTIHIPKDVDVVDDLRALQLVKGIPKLPDAKTGANKNRHGDSAIALALAYYASTLEAEAFGYHRVEMSPSGEVNAYQGNPLDAHLRERRVKVTGGIRGLRGGVL